MKKQPCVGAAAAELCVGDGFAFSLRNVVNGTGTSYFSHDLVTIFSF